MSAWNTNSIMLDMRKRVADKTAGWTEEELRESLAGLLAASYPIQTTLHGLQDNPKVPYGGMTVTSALFPQQFGEEHDLKEPWGFYFNKESSKLEPVAFKWGDIFPSGLECMEASFEAGETLHEDTPILSVCQYAIASSIFVGSFDLTDVRALTDAMGLPRPVLQEGEK